MSVALPSLGVFYIMSNGEEILDLQWFLLLLLFFLRLTLMTDMKKPTFQRENVRIYYFFFRNHGFKIFLKNL